MADAHKNAAYSLVATAPSPATSGTSLVVTAGEGGRFPSPPFNATVWASGAQPTFVAGGTTGGNFEIVRVTAISTDTFTITRAQESSSARTIVVGDQIAATVTVKTLTDVEAGLGYGASVFGDGSDGSVTFDGSTTILGMAPSSSVYSLTRDFFFSAVTLNSGVQIKTNGFRLFCSGTFTGVDATSIIQWSGSAAAVAVAGAAISNVSSSFSTGSGAGAPGGAGGAGGTTTGTGGTNITTIGWGGAGGTGGTGNNGANAGGAGGTLTANSATNASLRAAPAAILLRQVGGAGFSVIVGGSGGGGGGGDGTAGGGGGGGGGVVGVFVKTFAGTGAIQARGGKGGNPAAGNRGGGGGGGGGVVVVLSQSIVAGAVAGWTIDANAGGAGTSTGNGGLPGGGSNGTTILLPA